MAKNKIRWYVEVTDSSGKLIDEIFVLARAKNKAERVAIVLASDHFESKTSVLSAEAIPYNQDKHGLVTEDKYQLLAAAKWE